MKNVTVGRTVHFYPNGSEGHKLPNGMEVAPAIVVQVFDESVNLNVFTADPSGEPVKVMWSISHKDDVQEGQPYWAHMPVAKSTKESNVEPSKQEENANNPEKVGEQKADA